MTVDVLSEDILNEDILNEDDVIVAAEIDTIEIDTIEAAATASAIRIVRGNPTDADVAVLIAVLSAAATAPAGPLLTVKPPELFGSYEENLRHEPPTAPRNFVNASLHR